MHNGSQSSDGRSQTQAFLVSPDMLEDWLYNLAKQNRSAVVDSPIHAEYWSDSGTIELIFLCCDKLELSREVKYLAVEVFDRFLAKHIQSLVKQVETLSSETSYRWELVEPRLHNQIILRMISSIQLASKLDSHYKNLSPSEVHRFLREAGYTFNFEGIVASELRILETLEYHMNFRTPLTYLEVLLQVLAHNDPTIDHKVIRILALRILDAIYLQRDDVYSELYVTLTGERGEVISPAQRRAFAGVKADYMLLATVIVAVSAHVFDPQLYSSVAEHLHTVTRIKRRDIYNFSVVVIQVVLSSS